MTATMPGYLTWSVERELRPDERLLWKGRPRGGIRLRGFDAFMVPLSLVWGGFAFFWEFKVVSSVPKDNPAEWSPALFGIPFVLVGLYLIFGRFLVDARMRAKTEYAVTNRRAIIVSGLFSRKIKSIDLKSTPEIALEEKADRSGTITFGQAPAYSGWATQSNPLSPGMLSQQAFEMIDNVRQVYETIEQARGR
jgi:hypothetical protein